MSTREAATVIVRRVGYKDLWFPHVHDGTVVAIARTGRLPSSGRIVLRSDAYEVACVPTTEVRRTS